MEIIKDKFICIAGTKNNTNQEPLKKLTANGEAMVGQYKSASTDDVTVRPPKFEAAPY